MQRQIINIDPNRCDGCAKCISGCPEGALQLIDGKARVVSESTCDGLGACIRECPKGAISIETREAAAYDELETLRRIIPQGTATLTAHLRHLYEHAQTTFLNQALNYLRAQSIAIPSYESEPHSGCPGSTQRRLPTVGAGPATPKQAEQASPARDGLVSQLAQWPIQLHLIQPRSPLFTKQSVLLAADCAAFALPDFNQRFLPGKRLLVACPKLDQNQEIYLSKLMVLIDEQQITDIQVLIMEVPCCHGLLRLAQTAVERSSRKVPVTPTVVSLSGEVLN